MILKNRTSYYFDDIIRFWDRDIEFRNLLLDKKSYETYENIFIHDISSISSTSKGAKRLRVGFDKIDKFIKINNKIRYLILFDYSYFDKICDKIKYHISEKSGITDIINHNLQESELIQTNTTITYF